VLQVHAFGSRIHLTECPPVTVDHYDTLYKFMTDPECVFLLARCVENPAAAAAGGVEEEETAAEAVSVNKLVLTYEFPSEVPIEEVCFFVKTPGAQLSPFNDFDLLVQHGASQR
jgi:hypothetical protein